MISRSESLHVSDSLQQAGIRVFNPDGEEPPLSQQCLTLRDAYFKHKFSPLHKTRTVESYKNLLDHWERLTSNPDIREIDSEMLEAFKVAFLQSASKRTGKNYSPATWKKLKTHLFAILNRCGPRMPGNRQGRGIIEEIPYVEPVKVPRRVPRVATPEQVNAIYLACEAANWPRKTGVQPPGWWRALLVWLYNIGSRRNDFLRLRWDQIDFERRLYTSDEEKTGKVLPRPLNMTVIKHLRLIHQDRDLVFPKSKGTRMLYVHWYKIQKAAGIPEGERILFHELRKTCCTAFYQESPGAAQDMMGHSHMSTTHDSYWAPSRHLRDLADRIPQPDAFMSYEFE